MELFLAGIAAKYPIILTIFAVMGVARAIFKPLFTFLHAVAAATETQKDNEYLAKAESSSIYKAIHWVLDYTASIKLPAPVKKK